MTGYVISVNFILETMSQAIRVILNNVKGCYVKCANDYTL
jgi:hypothetical protein